MADAGEADRAVAALNGSNLNGRPLNVSEARPKPMGRPPDGQRRESRW